MIKATEEQQMIDDFLEAVNPTGLLPDVKEVIEYYVDYDGYEVVFMTDKKSIADDIINHYKDETNLKVRSVFAFGV